MEKLTVWRQPTIAASDLATHASDQLVNNGGMLAQLDIPDPDGQFAQGVQGEPIGPVEMQANYRRV
jgi:hypothetical protein